MLIVEGDVGLGRPVRGPLPRRRSTTTTARGSSTAARSSEPRASDAAGHELGRGARAPRRPHARQAASPSSATTSSPTGEMVELGRRGRRRARAPGASAPATSSGCSRTTASSSWPRSSPPTTSAPSPCRSTGGWRPRRCASSSTTPRPGPWCATTSCVELADDATGRLDGDLVRVVRRPPSPSTGGSASPTSATGPPPVAAGRGRRATTSTGSCTRRAPPGGPKGVMITHANLAWKNYAHITELGFTAADVGLACGPLYHVGALDLVTTSMIAVGATTIIHRVVRRRRGRRRDRALAGHPASGRRRPWCGRSSTSPASTSRDLSSVRVIIAGGEKMPIPTIERLRRTFPSAWFADAYGLTETVSGDTFLDRDSTVTKLGSVGRPCQYLELDIWDEEGAPLPAGRAGRGRAAGPEGVHGLLARPRRHRAGLRRRLVPHRRHRRASTTTATSTSSTGSRT